MIMAKNPKLTWRQVRVPEAGLTGRHRKPRTKRRVDESGTKATNWGADSASKNFLKGHNLDEAPAS